MRCCYDGGRDEAERALLAVLRISNKGVAHFTAGIASQPEDGNLLEIASCGVPCLIINHVYTPLGLPAPDYRIPGRPRLELRAQRGRELDGGPAAFRISEEDI